MKKSKNEDAELLLTINRRLAELSREYKKDGNSVKLFEALIAAQYAGINPSGWVIDNLAKGLKSYLSHESDSLDTAFKLNRKKKGKWTSPREKETLNRRDSDLVFFMIVLEEVFGMTAIEAAGVVCELKNVDIGARSLMDIHGKRAAETRKKFGKIHEGMTADELQELWKDFRPQ